MPPSRPKLSAGFIALDAGPGVIARDAFFKHAFNCILSRFEAPVAGGL